MRYFRVTKKAGMINRERPWEVMVEDDTDPFDVEHHHFKTKEEAEAWLKEEQQRSES